MRPIRFVPTRTIINHAIKAFSIQIIVSVYCVLTTQAQRPGPRGRWIVNRDAIPALTVAGWLGVSFICVFSDVPEIGVWLQDRDLGWQRDPVTYAHQKLVVQDQDWHA